MQEMIGVVLRHIGQGVGVIMVNIGLLNEDQTGLVIGMVVSLGALAWGICKAKGVKVCQDKKPD